MKKIFIVLGILFGLPLVIGIVAVALGFEPEEANPEKAADLRGQVGQRLSVLAAIVDDKDSSWATEIECPKDALQGIEKVEVLSYQQILDYLDYKSDDSLRVSDARYDLVSLDLEASDREVTDDTLAMDLQDIVNGSSLNYGEAATIYAAKILAVVRSERLEEPKTGAKFTGQFYGGSYQGKVRLVDVATKKTICQTSMTVASSDTIDKKLLERSGSAIKDDFENQMKLAKSDVKKRLGQAPLAW